MKKRITLPTRPELTATGLAHSPATTTLRRAQHHGAVALRALVFLTLALQAADAQWVQTNGPFGGQVRSLCVTGTELFAGTSGGVFHSANNGASWSARGLKDRKIMALTYSGSTLYAGGDGVLRSTDFGLTWTDISSGLGNTDVRSLCVSGTYVFAGTGAGVYRASTAGGSWTSVSSAALSSKYVLSLTVSGSFVVAGTLNGGIFRTKNYGSTWNNTNTGLTHLTVRALYRSATSNHLYAGGEGGVHLSTDNGSTWTVKNSGLITGTNNVPIVQGLSGTGARVYAGSYNGGVYASTDRGSSWTATPQQYNTLAMAVIGANVFAGTMYAGVHASTNRGTSWSEANAGIIASSVSALAVKGSVLFAGLATPADLFQTGNYGGTWTSTGLGYRTTSFLVNGSDLFAGTFGGGLQRSTDNGVSWTRSGTFGPEVRAIVSDGSVLYAGVSNTFSSSSANGVYRSDDNGATWSAVNTGLTYKKVYALAVIGTSLFAGTYDGGVFVSGNSGASWTAVNSGLTDLNVIALAVNGTTLYAGTWGGGVFVSNNNGASWTAVNTGMTNAEVWSFAVYGSNVFAGTGGGVFLTNNGGASWTNIGTGFIGALSINALEIFGTDLYAGTGGSGVWKRPLSEMISTPKHAAARIANDIRLAQNYPNPFNPTTTLSFTIPEDGHVQLRVYDALGREVAEMVNGWKAAGTHSAVFDAQHLSSGTYIARLEVNGAVLTGTMNLMK